MNKNSPSKTSFALHDTASGMEGNLLPIRHYDHGTYLIRTLPHPFIMCSFLHMLQKHGLCPSTTPARGRGLEALRRQFKAEVLPHVGLGEDAELWPLVQSLGVTRKDADAIVPAKLRGYIFVARLMDLYEDGHFDFPLALCMDPVLVIAAISRTRGRYYREDCTPDYRIGHFLETAFVTSDSRLFKNCLSLSGGGTL